MLFDRRDPPRWRERLRVALWPRRSWGRSARYVTRRLWRLKGSPHAIAIGCAAGVLASCTPFVGFHFLLGILLAWALGGSLIASALGTFVGNPLTFPLIWLSSYKVGSLVLGYGDRSFPEVDMSGGLLNMSFDQIWTLILPMTVGGLLIGAVMAPIAYFLVRRLAEAYQHRRRTKLELRAEEAQANDQDGHGSPFRSLTRTHHDLSRALDATTLSAAGHQYRPRRYDP